MSSNVIAIDEKEMRSIEALSHRDPEEAFSELRLVVTDLNSALHDLAARYPGAVALGAFCTGTPVGAVAFVDSAAGIQYSPVAPHKVQVLARIIAHLPPELLSPFRTEFNSVLEQRIRAEEAAAALRAAAEETGRGQQCE
jgi:hypothetical protein